MAYLGAGAPAVLGTLWDVTDRDCDRFGLEVLERWGLFQKREEVGEGAGIGKANNSVKKCGRREKKTKARRAAREQDGSDASNDGVREEQLGVSLVEAVATSRDACVLRYLNGAAPVVYGIPVWLM